MFETDTGGSVVISIGRVHMFEPLRLFYISISSVPLLIIVSVYILEVFTVCANRHYHIMFHIWVTTPPAINTSVLFSKPENHNHSLL